MVRARSALVLVLMASAAVACGGGNKKKQPAKPVAKKQTTKKKANKPPPPPVTDSSPNLAVDDDLIAKCKIPIDNKIEAPKFDYDRFELIEKDRQVLDVVAGCVTKDGPFAGRSLLLIGHTDNAGTVEYNLALGSKRASTVGDYLERQGVPSKQIGVTTRGEADAEGGDNDSRQVDRRVDITLEREKDSADKKDDAAPKEEKAEKTEKTEKTEKSEKSEKKDKKDKKADKDTGGF
jgi:peptidoglycan-associated lipoprotein